MPRQSSLSQHQQIAITLVSSILLLGTISLSNMRVFGAIAHEYGANPPTTSDDSGFGQRSEVKETGQRHSNEGEDERLGDRTSSEPTTLAPPHSQEQQINTHDLQIGLESPLLASQLPLPCWRTAREESW